MPCLASSRCCSSSLFRWYSVPETSGPHFAAVRVPVVEGPNTVYVRVTGGGDTLHLTSATRGLAVCLDSGAAGTVQLAGR